MKKILELKSISKAFGKVTVFHDVSLDLSEGEALALVGENGAGKSTLMNVLGGVYPVGEYTGEIYVSGQKAEFKSPADSKKSGIEMIHQEISLHLDMTVAENLFLGSWLTQNPFVSWKNIYKEAGRYLEMVGLDTDPRTYVYNLSTSQQQLLSIARALVYDPKIILFDEPTSALTESDAANLLTIIKGLCAKGMACIYISHKLEEVFDVADRIVVLRDGSVISDMPKSQTNVDQVIEQMVGRKMDEMYPKRELPIGDTVMTVENITVPHPYVKDRNMVEDISFSVRSGEILGFSGLVGSGRSETMNAIFGTLKKTSGKIELGGRTYDFRSPLQAIKSGIGLVTEDRKKSGIIGPMNIRENMTIASLAEISDHSVINKRRENEVTDSFYDKLKVKAQGTGDNILNLSGGNQQKVVLAKWLMKDIKVLILDEPTRGVDVGAKVEIYNIITELASKGVAIVMVSSELQELMGMCDRIIVMGRGRIQGNVGRKDFSQDRIMRAATCVETFGI